MGDFALWPRSDSYSVIKNLKHHPDILHREESLLELRTPENSREVSQGIENTLGCCFESSSMKAKESSENYIIKKFEGLVYGILPAELRGSSQDLG